MAKAARVRAFNAVPDFSDSITMECDPTDPEAPYVAWDWWAPASRDRYTVHIECRPKGQAGVLHVPSPHKARGQVFVLCETEVLGGEKVRFTWKGYAMRGDFLARAQPGRLEGYHGFSLPADQLSPIFHVWAAMVGCKYCRRPLNGAMGPQNRVCSTCAAHQPLQV